MLEFISADKTGDSWHKPNLVKWTVSRNCQTLFWSIKNWRKLFRGVLFYLANKFVKNVWPRGRWLCGHGVYITVNYADTVYSIMHSHWLRGHGVRVVADCADTVQIKRFEQKNRDRKSRNTVPLSWARREGGHLELINGGIGNFIKSIKWKQPLKFCIKSIKNCFT